MPTFSQRYGYVPTPVLQVESLSLTTRNAIWNFLKIVMWNHHEYSRESYSPETPKIEYLASIIWSNFLKLSLDDLPEFSKYETHSGYKELKKFFLKAEWHQAYSFLEFLVLHWPTGFMDRNDLVATLNIILRDEMCAYRFIGLDLVPISDQNEMKAIDDALKVSLPSTSKHLQNAITLLSDRLKPQYENSIKESICAIEALVQSITSEPKGTLGAMLKSIDGIHPSFIEGLSKIYGFTCDEAGIRHGTSKESLKYFAV